MRRVALSVGMVFAIMAASIQSVLLFMTQEEVINIHSLVCDCVIVEVKETLMVDVFWGLFHHILWVAGGHWWRVVVQ